MRKGVHAMKYTLLDVQLAGYNYAKVLLGHDNYMMLFSRYARLLSHEIKSESTTVAIPFPGSFI